MPLKWLWKKKKKVFKLIFSEVKAYSAHYPCKQYNSHGIILISLYDVPFSVIC